MHERIARAVDGVRIDRRTTLGILGALGLGAVAAACGGSSSSNAGTTKRGSAPKTGRQPSCVLAPEMTEGPYYLELKMVRSDITEGRPGTPLVLAISVVDATTCAPISNAAVDLWHADATGEYSGFGGPGGLGGGGPTDNLTFLRGTQMTDATGKSTFTTIYPGWYPGRAVHIHVKVHVGGNVIHTGQLFFPDDVTDEAYRASPYSSRGTPDVRNAADDIYLDGGKQSTLAPRRGANGYDAAITLGVRSQ